MSSVEPDERTVVRNVVARLSKRVRRCLDLPKSGIGRLTDTTHQSPAEGRTDEDENCAQEDDRKGRHGWSVTSVRCRNHPCYLDDGRIEIDSNTVERSIRGVCLTRKNALFAGHDQGGSNWAITDEVDA